MAYTLKDFLHSPHLSWASAAKVRACSSARKIREVSVATVCEKAGTPPIQCSPPPATPSRCLRKPPSWRCCCRCCRRRPKHSRLALGVSEPSLAACPHAPSGAHASVISCHAAVAVAHLCRRRTEHRTRHCGMQGRVHTREGATARAGPTKFGITGAPRGARTARSTR